MRVVHSSDWHLGRRLGEVSLVEDQAYALEQLLAICRDERADALIVAGDVYDRAVPPEDAVRLLGEFVVRAGIPLIVISGNHDSADRLGFGAPILERAQVHLRTSFERRAAPIVLEAGGERAFVYALPFLDPDAVRIALGDEGIRGQDAAVRAALAAVHADRRERRADTAVLVAHLFAQGGRESVDSERPLMIGGTPQVGASALDGFSYVALGHLHEPQCVGRDDIRYSGSLLKYSFGEARQEKCVTLVELSLQGACAHAIPLTPRRDVVRIAGSFAELLDDPRFAFAEPAYVEATYSDRTYIVDVAVRLRARFPHLLSALPAAVAPGEGSPLAGVEPARDPAELLAGFWQHVGAGALAEEHVKAFERALDRATRRETREVAA